MNIHVTILEIDGYALKHNLQYFKQKLEAETKLIVVVKAFGYCSQAAEIAKFLENDVDYFAVAYTDEGIALRNAGIESQILVSLVMDMSRKLNLDVVAEGVESEAQEKARGHPRDPLWTESGRNCPSHGKRQLPLPRGGQGIRFDRPHRLPPRRIRVGSNPCLPLLDGGAT